MVRKVTGLLAAGLAVWLTGHLPPCQAQELPPAPSPATQPAPKDTSPETTPPPHLYRPPTPVLTGPPRLMPYSSIPPPPVVPDPNFSIAPPAFEPPGLFASVELGLVGPHVKNRLSASVPFDGFLPDTVQVPNAPLDWTVSPRFELGYRLPQDFGEFLASFRFLVTQGSAIIPGFNVVGDGLLHSRLNLNVLDLDYASREFALGPNWDMKWKVGARLANVFFDSRVDGLFVDQRTSNFFLGAGPHAGLDLGRRLGDSGLSLFTRSEGAVLIGRITQSFEETFFFNDGTPLGGATIQRQVQAVPLLSFQVGLGWTPPWSQDLRLALGYQFERWWYLGRVGDSRAELTVQGIFFRGEFRY